MWRDAPPPPHFAATQVLSALSSLAVPAGEPVPCEPVTCPGHVRDMSGTCPAGEPVPCDSWLDAEDGEGEEEGSASLGAAPGSGGCSVGSSYHSDKVEGSYYTERIGASGEPQLEIEHEIEINLEIDKLEAEHVGEGEAEVGGAEVGGAAAARRALALLHAQPQPPPQPMAPPRFPSPPGAPPSSPSPQSLSPQPPPDARRPASAAAPLGWLEAGMAGRERAKLRGRTCPGHVHDMSETTCPTGEHDRQRPAHAGGGAAAPPASLL